MSNAKLWGGRFSESTSEAVEAFSESVSFDARLWKQDIAGSKAHARMLGRVGVLGEADVTAICDGLDGIATDIEAGAFVWDTALEDVHMNIESALTERIGEAGKRLHTGRSRNDQIATDVRLYVREAIDGLCSDIDRLDAALSELAGREADTIMPGFTHLQVAQPVTFGHHMLAWREQIRRDRERFMDTRRRTNLCPLGSAALAGTVYPIDREWVAAELGFDGVTANSLDSVSDRDFAIDFVHAASQLMVHLSRWSEELILWSTQMFNFVQLPDRFCTGSSIMPQKKNPDVPELVRGKTARVTGDLMSLLMLMKSQPLAYNRDNQEDKEPLFDAHDTVAACVRLYAELIPALVVNRDACRAAAIQGYSTATDLADYLVRKGMAFRDAHHVVGSVVGHAVNEGSDLAALSLETLKGFSETIEADVFDVLTVEGSVVARDHVGGTAPKRVRNCALSSPGQR